MERRERGEAVREKPSGLEERQGCKGGGKNGEEWKKQKRTAVRDNLISIF